jgi:hypothetical protein
MLHIGTKYDAMLIQDFSLIGLWLMQVFSHRSHYHFVLLKFDKITVRSNYLSLHYPRQFIFFMKFVDRNMYAYRR